MRTWAFVERRLNLIVAVLYVVVTLWMTWPLPRYAGSAVQDRGDPIFQTWIMRAVQHQLATDPRHLYDTNTFYPFEQSLAYSEEAISTALLGWPIYLVTGNDILMYNVLFLFSFWLVAFAVYLLALELGASPGAALIAGCLAAFSQARFGHISHLNMLTIGWLPLALWAFTRWSRGGRGRYLLGGSLALLTQLLASQHLAVFSTLALGLYLLFLAFVDRQGRPVNGRVVAAAAVALAVPYVIFGLTLIPHLQVGNVYGFERTRNDVQQLAATPSFYVNVFANNHFWKGRLDVSFEPFFPGAVAIVGGLLAVLAWRRWPVIYTALLLLAAVLLSFGFYVVVSGREVPMPYAALFRAFPPIRAIRGVGRFGLLTGIALPLLAAFGYTALWARIRPRLGGPPRALAVGLALTLVLSLAGLFEMRGTVGTERVPNDARAMAVYEWLAEQPEGPTIEFPADGLLIHPGDPLTKLFQPLQYMYGSTRHWNPLFNAYSSFLPHEYVDILAAYDARDGRPSMVTEGNVGLLQDIGIRWVVIHHSEGYDWRAATAAADAIPALRRVASVGDSTVYELSDAGREPVTADFTLPETAGTGVAWSFTAHVTNPNPTLAVSRLRPGVQVDVRWLQAGRVVQHDTATLDVPTALPPGTLDRTLSVPAPNEPGEYVVEVSVDEQVLSGEASQRVTVALADELGRPELQLVGVEWDRDRTLQPGDTLHVEVTWTPLAPLSSDYAATLQLIDADGVRRAGADLLPGTTMPASSTWQPGDDVTLSFDLAIPADTPPGDYQLLTALYARQDDFPRLPILLPDGTQAMEAIVGPLRVE